MSGPKISLALNGRNNSQKPTNGVKRPHAALQDEEEDDSQYGRSEQVSHFDRKKGAFDEAAKKKDEGPLVIQRQANRNWKEEAERKRKRQRSGLPEGAGGGAGIEERMKDVEAKDAAKKPGLGLNLYKRERGTGEEVEMEGGGGEGEEQEPPRQKTDDEIAMDALLGKTSHDKSLTIAAATEEEAFQNDIENAPEMASLDDYARVPVEQFGAALLRGMGWKEGEGIGSQKGKKLPKDINKLPERRANLLGIGAKEDAALAAEMGAWGKGGKGGKEVKVYNPVLLKDKRTGEMFTEDELEKRKEREERERYEKEFERKEKDRRREKDRDREREKDRRRYRDDESDEEYYRRKDKERRRRERDREDEYDRERRSERRHRDGDRDRDRDRDRRRERDRDRGDRDRDRDRDRRR